ncbi:hypothetical protein P3644_03700 [Vibrio parahaemolyticus]|uniref:DUF6795 domain-containing protein n=1 Tax=Vibrio parahaemolyticus TaxID=670 RepID=UPI00111E44C7|nr:carboxypeptidase-like regulatory domain-containing protein [Vibrio parahaemolyticus]MBE4296783.1 carboxypeptidase regulatory-like domain-containing protein [Vibrio parahaemolyticus]MBE4301279.1 carboxypeptidase regulatory-like domain-containing protein [Vibrio parahaemolyticus]MDF4726007.1 hypothetical protein [Vibrio parahaemolyticus]MDF4952361.1 hypothetical protein [Vibrio parahaemolyticus]MDF4998966.1 hypothetical protein [Vibrio parahaemolyticus]
MIDNVFLFLEQFADLLMLVLISVFAVGFLFCGKEAREFTPRIKGRITKEDIPIKNANVVLNIRSANRSFERSFTTNINGEFKFDPVFRKRNKVLSIFDGLFQTICSVEVTTTVANHKVVIWKGIFRHHVIGVKERVNMSNLNCEATNPIRKFEFQSHGDFVSSQCDLSDYLRVNR